MPLCECGCGQMAKRRFIKNHHGKIKRELILCACGCGNKLLNISKWYRHNHFIRGHNVRVNCPWKGTHLSQERRLIVSQAKKGHKYNLGKRHSEATRQLWSNQRKGKPKSPEHRKKIGIANKGKIRTTEMRVHYSNVKKGLYINSQNPFFGKQHTSETIKNLSMIRKEWWKNPEHRARGLQQIAHMPKHNSRIERIIQAILNKNGIVYETQSLILGRPDIFIAPNICIFVDGCYWHGCEIHFDRNQLTARQRRMKVRDLMVTQALQNAGYVVFRFWEHDVYNLARLHGVEISNV